MRRRVLVVAEAANPEWVSVPLVGWSHAQAIARRTDCLVATQVRNREAWLRAGKVEGRDFVAIDSEAVARPTTRLGNVLRGGKGKGWTTMTAAAALSYYAFEWKLWRMLGAEIAAGRFEVVHRVTPLSPTIPSLVLARGCERAGVPFVVGPMNGGVPWPRGYDGVRRAEREWLSYVREVYKLLPGYRRTRRQAAALLVASRDTWQQMPEKYHDKCVYLPENAVDPERFARVREHAAARPMRVVFVGRLVPYKGADVLLEAVAPLVREGRVCVEVIGDGPQMAALRALVERERLGDGVTLAGWVAHEQVQDRMATADVFGFPSIREFGGGVVLEAMAVGLVPVVVGYGGPAELVTEQTGVALPMTDRAGLVEAFRAALAELAAEPGRVDAMSAAARRRVCERFTWDAKAAVVEQVYEWVLDPSGRRRPVF
ncbi:glycosyltransferase family 4 protein [Phycisphaerales bacterium AB-hyl4]|uniref:Glycosyltransferase family 4 protein n=1 Tax=Natronomicrosphaera hydrolytica TaxID=3242702 RepID=A0ABV4UB14_9BACT